MAAIVHKGGGAHRAATLLGILVLCVVASGSTCTAVLGPTACTLIGCEDGFTLEVLGGVPAPATVRVSWEGGELTFSCAPGAACQAFVGSATPESITVQVTWDDGGFTLSTTPAYSNVRPNGRGCPPVCRQARVEVRVS
jgi:hypothetical protein